MRPIIASQLCHRKKVALRKAVQALRENDRMLGAGLEDPITEYYGCSDVIFDAHRRVVQKIVSKVSRAGFAFRPGWDSAYDIEELAVRARLVKPLPEPDETRYEEEEAPC